MAERTRAQQLSWLLGIVFILVGILGFIPGITTHYGDLSFAGHDSGAKLFGIFEVSILHNVVHVLFGIVGLLLAKTAEGARTFLIGGGVVYLVLWIYGLVIDQAAMRTSCRSTRPTTGSTSRSGSRWSRWASLSHAAACGARRTTRRAGLAVLAAEMSRRSPRRCRARSRRPRAAEVEARRAGHPGDCSSVSPRSASWVRRRSCTRRAPSAPT